MATILLIEHFEDLHQNIAEMLILADHDVISAYSGQEGLKLAREQLPDVILGKSILPDIDGCDLLELFKYTLPIANIPFIMLSVKTESDEIRKGLKRGALAYVKKPFSEESLLDAVNFGLNGNIPNQCSNSSSSGDKEWYTLHDLYQES